MLLLMTLPGMVIVVVIVSPSRSAPSGSEGFMEIDNVSALSLTVTSSWGTFEVALQRIWPPGAVTSSIFAAAAYLAVVPKYSLSSSQLPLRVRIESVVSSNTISVYWPPSALNSTFASIRHPLKHTRHTPNATTAPRRPSLPLASETPLASHGNSGEDRTFLPASAPSKSFSSKSLQSLSGSSYCIPNMQVFAKGMHTDCFHLKNRGYH